MSQVTFQFQQFRENRRMAKSVSLKDNHHNEPVTDLLLLPTCGCVFMCVALHRIGLFFWSEEHCVQQVIRIFCLFPSALKAQTALKFPDWTLWWKTPKEENLPIFKLLYSNLLVKKCLKVLPRFWKVMMICVLIHSLLHTTDSGLGHSLSIAGYC